EKIKRSPQRYHAVGEFQMSWRHGGERPDPKDPSSYYTSHHGAFDSVADAVKAHHYGDSKRASALHDIIHAEPKTESGIDRTPPSSQSVKLPPEHVANMEHSLEDYGWHPTDRGFEHPDYP